MLIVGAGPAGLECAQALGRRGYQVHLAEAGRELGGRVLRESKLHGLGQWIRVRDWRVQPDREDAERVRLPGERDDARTTSWPWRMPTVILATGAVWRSDGFGRRNHKPIPAEPGAILLSPDDVMDGTAIDGPGGRVRRRRLLHGRRTGRDVAPAWAGGDAGHALAAGFGVDGEYAGAGEDPAPGDGGRDRRDRQPATSPPCARARVELACVFTGRKQTRVARSVVLVTARRSRAELYDALPDQVGQHGLRTLLRVGDCFQPGTIATAVFGGRRVAEGLDQPASDIIAFRTEPVATDRPLHAPRHRTCARRNDDDAGFDRIQSPDEGHRSQAMNVAVSTHHHRPQRQHVVGGERPVRHGLPRAARRCAWWQRAWRTTSALW